MKRSISFLNFSERVQTAVEPRDAGVADRVARHGRVRVLCAVCVVCMCRQVSCSGVLVLNTEAQGMVRGKLGDDRFMDMSPS
jgi:hypothetical protein